MSSRSRRSRRNATGGPDFSGLPPPDYFNNPGSSNGPRRGAVFGHTSSRLPPIDEDRRYSRSRSDSFDDPMPPVSYAENFSSPGPQMSSHVRQFPGRFRPYDDLDFLPQASDRRNGVDHSSTAYDFYDPFMGALRRDSERNRASVQGDPELPTYRSASAYAREQRPPSYSSDGGYYSRETPPPRYTSLSSSRYGSRSGPPPMQYPATRRPSEYTRSRSPPRMSSRSDFGSSGRRPATYDHNPPPEYYLRKWD